MKSVDGLFRDEEGLTTVSMVLSLLITLSLLFTAAQVYRIQSASAEVQDVADAAALSAQNQVAEFMLVARYCDAVVLSLSLTGTIITGLGIVALCTPATAELSESLIDAGKKVMEARNTFSDRASDALNKLQKALPYFSAACAASVARANNRDSSGADYLGAALLVPTEGKELKPTDAKKADKLAEDVDEKADDVRDNAEQAEDAAEEANKAKIRAFQSDCGNNPDYCMYERASHLAGLSGAANPYYASVDAWTFSVALKRAQKYYAVRSNNDTPESSSVHDQAQSALRKRFYRYAAKLLESGYVHESDDSFEAYFPHLPTSIDEMRTTELYTETVYPVTIETTEKTVVTEAPVTPEASEMSGMAAAEEGPYQSEVTIIEQKYVMHAWPGCPAAGSPASYGSLRMLEGGGFETCPLCEFTVRNMGNIASMTTRSKTGFEYHYAKVAEAAEVYQKERKKADELKDEVKTDVNGLLKELVAALKEGADKRIEPEPPGRYGSIAFVVNVGTTSVTGGFTSRFVSGFGTLGPRAAVAGATLLDEGSDEGRTVLNAVLDGLRDNGGVAVGAAGMVLDAWSWLVVAYGNGQSSLKKAIEQGLNGMPLMGASGLGTWAAKKLDETVESIGLQPAQVGALKAVLVNSGHVAAKGDGQAAGFLAVKRQVIAHPLMSTDLFSSVLSDAERQILAQIDSLGDSVQIASIELLGEGGPTIPITIPLPDAAKAYGTAVVQGLFARLRSFYIQTTEVNVWE